MEKWTHRYQGPLTPKVYAAVLDCSNVALHVQALTLKEHSKNWAYDSMIVRTFHSRLVQAIQQTQVSIYHSFSQRDIIDLDIPRRTLIGMSVTFMLHSY
jgi:hypothetical protein